MNAFHGINVESEEGYPSGARSVKRAAGQQSPAQKQRGPPSQAARYALAIRWSCLAIGIRGVGVAAHRTATRPDPTRVAVGGRAGLAGGWRLGWRRRGLWLGGRGGARGAGPPASARAPGAAHLARG